MSEGAKFYQSESAHFTESESVHLERWALKKGF